MFAGDVNECFNANRSRKCQPYYVSCPKWEIVPKQNTANLGCYTFAGQSGSPVWIEDLMRERRVIRGVLIAQIANMGRFAFITNKVFDWLQSHVRQIKA